MDVEQVKRIIAEFANRYPALITVDQAVEISQSPRSTVYDWSSRGLLDDIKAPGRQLLLDRNGFVIFLIYRNKKTKTPGRGDGII